MTTIASKPTTRLAQCQLPIYDFLAPRYARRTFCPRAIRTIHTSSSLLAEATTSHDASDTITPKPSNTAASPLNPPTSKPLTQAQRDFLSSALRVNQAGELAATLIYKAQTPPIIAAHPHLRPLMKHMYDQEAAHFSTFNALVAKHRVRPTAMYPVWVAAATALGWGTAILGRETAMACTEAVETEIGSHYNAQVAKLLEMLKDMDGEGVEAGEELRTLLEDVRRIRDEELEHLDHALENDAKQAVPHELLTGVIRAGCRGAIWISERV